MTFTRDEFALCVHEASTPTGHWIPEGINHSYGKTLWEALGTMPRRLQNLQAEVAEASIRRSPPILARSAASESFEAAGKGEEALVTDFSGDRLHLIIRGAEEESSALKPQGGDLLSSCAAQGLLAEAGELFRAHPGEGGQFGQGPVGGKIVDHTLPRRDGGGRRCAKVPRSSGRNAG